MDVHARWMPAMLFSICEITSISSGSWDFGYTKPSITTLIWLLNIIVIIPQNSLPVYLFMHVHVFCIYVKHTQTVGIVIKAAPELVLARLHATHMRGPQILQTDSQGSARRMPRNAGQALIRRHLGFRALVRNPKPKP